MISRERAVQCMLPLMFTLPTVCFRRGYIGIALICFAHMLLLDPGLDNSVFEDLTRKLRTSDVSKYIQSLKEMYVDFYSRFYNIANDIAYICS